MGAQFIFVVEADEKCRSDWNYIKATIERFYTYDPAHVKLKPVYMAGKNNYRNKKKEVNTLMRKYKGNTEKNQSIVIYCFDCDEYDTRKEDSLFLEEARTFCEKNGYYFVWFCKDVERVYLGKKVADRDKKKNSCSVYC